MPEPVGSQPAADRPDHFQMMCDITRKRAEELKRACFTCHEDNSGTVMLCPLHAAAPRLKEALENVLEAEWMVTHDWGGDRGTILTEARALLREIEG